MGKKGSHLVELIAELRFVPLDTRPFPPYHLMMARQTYRSFRPKVGH